MADVLTRAKIEKFVSAGVPAGKSQAVLWDGMVTGLGLRLRLGGAASWTFQYRPKGVGRAEPSRKVTLGSWPTLAIDAARSAAQAMAGAVALKQDPATDLRDERNRERRNVSKALDEYERAITRRKLVNVPTIMSTLRRGLAPLAAREIDALTRADLVERIEALEAAGLPGAAADLRKHARSLLEWAVSRGLVQFNVLAGLRRPRSSRAERLGEESKGKALSDEEIVALWNGAAAMGPFGGLMRLGLLTGMRRSELAGLRWDDVHGRQDHVGGAWDQDWRHARSSADCGDAQRIGSAAEGGGRSRIRVAPPNGGDAIVRLDEARRRCRARERRRVPLTRLETNGSHAHVAARRGGRSRRTRGWACAAWVDRCLQQGRRLEGPRVCVRTRVCTHRAACVWRSRRARRRASATRRHFGARSALAARAQ